MEVSNGAKPEPGKTAQPESIAGRRGSLLSHYLLEARGRVATWRERRALERELGSLGDRELADVGLMRWQVPDFVRSCPSAAELLAAMLERLGLEADERLSERLLHDDVYRNCVMCEEHGRCRRWMDSADAAAEAPVFCPNAWTFRQLLAAKREQGAKAP